MSKLMNSGINWIGTMPSDWDVKKIKYVGELNGRIGWQGLNSSEYKDEGPYLITGIDFKDGRIDWDTCVHIDHSRWEEAKKIQIKNGDLLITKDGTVGKVAIVENLEGLASLNSGVLKINLKEGYLAKFLFYVLQSDVFCTWFNYTSSGNSTILHLYEKDFNNFIFCVPSFDEQMAIANYLQSKIENIDSIIWKTEKQLEMLEKYKKSLIKETVTQGLNKGIALKETEYEWIGRIPLNWKVTKIKYYSEIYSGEAVSSNEYQEEGYPIMGANGVLGYYDKKNIATDVISTGRVGTIGTFYLVRDCWATDNVLVIETKDIKLHYLYYYLQIVDIESLSTATAQPLITSTKLKNIPLLIPSHEEQSSIANYLNKKLYDINKILGKKKQQISKLHEVKASIIYEYVTGKKRVGGFSNGD
ncbi:MAG: restriction endonuclease subunit S [Finegoldia magna]|uniref:restriction endonuclease subunit S n=1 Tax=Finegoldia magna TaxID=1260 RepID=UPI002908834C|nr:restriction endonuclease subunit S [Finegoldia magna]MDU7891340.1 restriction endonuclease subunit S [Finegoldia magna]